jgi:hypothetical protein
MELVLKTSEQKCFVGSNPTASAVQHESLGPMAVKKRIYQIETVIDKKPK